MGIQNGLDEEEIETRFARHTERMAQTLLQAFRPELLRDYQSGDPVARSIYICSSGGRKGLGFSVNNSGLLLCPAGIGPELGSEGKADELVASNPSARKLSFPYVSVAVGQLLQAIQIDTPTSGLVPAYINWLGDFPDEDFFALGEDGERVSLKLSAFDLTAKIQTTWPAMIAVDHCIEFEMDPKSRLIGGPILTQREEVLAVQIAQSQTTDAGFVYVYARPWSMLDTCIIMGGDPMP